MKIEIENAKKLLDAGDINEAKELLLTISRSNPSEYSVCILLCGISTRTNDWILGKDSFEHLVKLRPSNSLASSGLVQSYWKLGDYDKALQEIDRFKDNADLTNESAKNVLEEHKQVSIAIRKIQNSDN